MNELIYVFISLVSRLNGTIMKSELKKSTINTILNLYNTHIQRHNHYKKYWETNKRKHPTPMT